MKISAMILTGGRSTRMGRDKAYLEFGSPAGNENADAAGRDSFLGHLIRELSEKEPECQDSFGCDAPGSSERVVLSELFLSAAHAGDYPDMGLRVVADEHRGIGPIEGILQGLYTAREEHLFVCAVDMPFVTRDMVLSLAKFICEDYDAYVFREGERIHPACAIYRRSVIPYAEQMISEGSYRLKDLLDRVRTRYVDIEEASCQTKRLMNINTPREYDEVVWTGESLI